MVKNLSNVFRSATPGLFAVCLLCLFFLASCGGTSAPKDSTTVVAQSSSAGQGEKAPEVSFEKLTHDFGKIFSGEKVTYNFRFTNTGDAPLIIIHTRSGCGCTVGEYPKEPIPPGREARINVTFNSAGRRGFQSESVRVITNANPQEYLLRVTAEVIQN